MSETMRELSKRGWTGIGIPQDINCGSLQRIADAAELMARNHLAMQEEMERVKTSRDYWKKRAAKLERKLSATKGVVTKLKANLGEVRP